MVGGKPAERRLTPWLRGLADDAAAGPRRSRAGPPADWRARLADQRALLAVATPPVSPRLAALQAWRDDQARAARVEPAALVDDRLLEMIAEARPPTHDELVAVPGMGPLLAARVGDGLLAALAARPRPRLVPDGQHPDPDKDDMDFTVTQTLRRPRRRRRPRLRVPRAVRRSSTGLPKLGPPEVLERTVDGDVVRLQIRYRFVGDLSPAVTAVLDPAKLTWVEHSTHDLGRRSVTLPPGPRPLPRPPPVVGDLCDRPRRRRGGPHRPWPPQGPGAGGGRRRRAGDRLGPARVPGGRGRGRRPVRRRAARLTARRRALDRAGWRARQPVHG